MVKNEGRGPESKENAVNIVTYNVPNVSCGHCKMNIEREIGKLSGVASITVDVNSKKAIIKYESPATEAEIETLLIEIGYPPEN
jgi:copper chaperone CopZ